MKKRFKEIRVFCGNQNVGHDFYDIEFVYDNNILQSLLMKLNVDANVCYSRIKSDEFVFNPQNSQDFIKALKRTQLSENLLAYIYDEDCLLAQDYNNPSSGVNYIKDENEQLTFDKLMDVASAVYFNAEDKDAISKFKKECLDLIGMEEQNGQSEEREQ